MKILWVKAGGLVPLDSGGKIRSYHILKELARHHQVTLFTFYGERPDDPHPALSSVFDRVEAIPLKLAPARSAREGVSYAWNLFSSLPHTILKFCQPEVGRRIRALVRESPPEVLVCDFIVPAAAIPWEHPCPKIIFTHNIEAQIWQRHCQAARSRIWKAVAKREYKAMEQAERKFLKKADHVLTVSEPDRDFFSRFIDPSRITAIPTGVDTEYFRPRPGNEMANRLVFTGSMDWMPNEDGILYFVREVLPHIRRRAPDITLCVVGRRPSERLRAMAGGTSGVEITGRVDDIRPFVHDAAVYVVPLRIGGGTRLKIFEAMAMGKAVVSTTIGAEGLPVHHGQDILLEDDPQRFAEAVLQLLESPEPRLQIGAAARQLVENGYSWAAIGSSFGEILEKVTSRHREAVSLRSSARVSQADTAI
jgi:sugar transferase (PEP-CTERM/EpsH1 system associated)